MVDCTSSDDPMDQKTLFKGFLESCNQDNDSPFSRNKTIASAAKSMIMQGLR